MKFSAFKCSPLRNSLTVKPALEKHLLEEADGTGTQRLLEIGKLKICGLEIGKLKDNLRQEQFDPSRQEQFDPSSSNSLTVQNFGGPD